MNSIEKIEANAKVTFMALMYQYESKLLKYRSCPEEEFNMDDQARVGAALNDLERLYNTLYDEPYSPQVKLDDGKPWRPVEGM